MVKPNLHIDYITRNIRG